MSRGRREEAGPPHGAHRALAEVLTWLWRAKGPLQIVLEAQRSRALEAVGPQSHSKRSRRASLESGVGPPPAEAPAKPPNFVSRISWSLSSKAPSPNCLNFSPKPASAPWVHKCFLCRFLVPGTVSKCIVFKFLFRLQFLFLIFFFFFRNTVFSLYLALFLSACFPLTT